MKASNEEYSSVQGWMWNKIGSKLAKGQRKSTTVRVTWNNEWWRNGMIRQAQVDHIERSIKFNASIKCVENHFCSLQHLHHYHTRFEKCWASVSRGAATTATTTNKMFLAQFAVKKIKSLKLEDWKTRAAWRAYAGSLWGGCVKKKR